MRPILFEICGFAFPAFGICFSLGFVIPFLILKRQTRQDGWAEGDLESLMIAFFAGGVLGARGLFVIESSPYFQSHPLEALCVWKGGLSFFGGMVGSLLTGSLFAWSRGIHPAALADRLLPLVALGHGLGRVGCFLHGCCYGERTDLPWAMAFPRISGDLLPRHPTQAYEAILLFTLAAVLLRAWYRRDRGSVIGQITSTYLIGYGLIRLAGEALRGDSWALLLAGLRPYQAAAVVCILAGILLRIRPLTHGVSATAETFESSSNTIGSPATCTSTPA